MPISQLMRAAVSGMVGQKLRLDVIANNLANVDTAGYKSSRVNFQDVLYQAHLLATTNRDLRVGAGVVPAAIQSMFTQGSLQQTDIPTDLAIFGDGFFQVRLADGTTGYTRNGAFRVDADGRLVTADGHAVVPDIVVPLHEPHSLTVDRNGAVRIIRPGQADSEEIGQIQIATFTNPEGLEARGQTMFVQGPASGGATIGLPNTPGFGQVVSQALEVSNVNLAEEMSNLVVAQRAYGLSLRALQTIDEMIGLANNIRSR
ncbi:MAG: flagellar basal-body rod protein FlgG [Chloroflexi bacterium]|nr:flagellar basal-body rod protein FlgG [Chloroflexota bacterium]